MHFPHDWVNDYQDVEYNVDVPGFPSRSSSQPSVSSQPPERQPMLSAPEAAMLHDKSAMDPESIPPSEPPSIPPSPNSSGFNRHLVRRTSDPDLGSANRTFPPQRSFSSQKLFTSSPLNPAPHGPPVPYRFSSYNAPQLRQLPSEDSRVLSWAGNPSPSPSISRGSMILYRLIDHDEFAPPKISHSNRRPSSSGDSVVSISSDSKYPSAVRAARGIIPYAYDPMDDLGPDNEEDFLHDPRAKDKNSHNVPWRGFLNVGMLTLLLLAIIALFVGYPVISDFNDNGASARIVGNVRINSTGQASDENVPVGSRSQIPMDIFVDASFPSAYRLSKEGVVYELVFSEEFNDDARDFASDTVWKTDPVVIHGPMTGRNTLFLTKNFTASSHGDILQFRTPLCVDRGFLEFGIKKSGEGSDRRVFWSGNWEFAGLHDQTPSQDPDLYTAIVDIRVALQDPTLLSSSNPLDYVRLYRRQDTSSSANTCAASEHITLYLV